MFGILANVIKIKVKSQSLLLEEVLLMNAHYGILNIPEDAMRKWSKYQLNTSSK